MSRLDLRLGDRSISVDPGAEVTIGRDSASTLPIQHELVSRRHAVIAFDGSAWVVTDQGSTNGVYLGAVKSGRIELTGSGVVHLGDDENGPALEFEVIPYAVPAAVAAPAAEPLEFSEHTRLSGPRAQPFREVPREVAPAAPDRHVVTMGSAADNVVVLEDPFVSRHHVRLVEVDAGFIVDDLNSLNGTYLNGQLISTGFLGHGDRLTIGNHDFVAAPGRLETVGIEEAPTGGLSVRGLGFTLSNGKRLLHGIDLDAPRGTLTAVIGPSGAGKSTFSRALTGATAPSAGVARFDDFDIHRDYELVRTRIGLVPQEDVLHRTLTVTSALGYAAQLRIPGDKPNRERQIERAITQLGLEQHRRTRVDKLSGGQRKRASVALELLTEPALLVLDEPTSGLDPALDRQVMHTLRELADGGRAVLVVTHSVAYLDVCDQVLVLAPGGMPAYLGPASGIAAHFGTDDWAEVFARIAADPAGSYDRYRVGIPPLPPAPPPLPTSSTDRRPHARVPWSRQLATVALRQLAVVRSDVGYSLFLALLPVVLGMLALVVPGNNGFQIADIEFLGEPSQLLSLMIIGSCFVGSAMSIRDLVGERPIFLRERAVGLSVGAYLAAKVLVFGTFSWIAAAIMVGIVRAGKDTPAFALITGSGTFDLFLAIGVTTATSALLGLALSALVRSSEQAMPVLVVVLMTQLVLHGGLIPVTGRAVLEQISWFIPARWGFAAGASSIDLERLVPTIDDDALWAHDPAVWWADMLVVIGFGALFAIIAAGRLRRMKS